MNCEKQGCDKAATHVLGLVMQPQNAKNSIRSKNYCRAHAQLASETYVSKNYMFAIRPIGEAQAPA